MIDKKTIEKLAVLARIELTSKEEERFKTELSLVLDYVEKLNQVNTDDIVPFYQAGGIENATRPDEKNSLSQKTDVSSKLIKEAPDNENNFIKVKSILKK